MVPNIPMTKVLRRNVKKILHWDILFLTILYKYSLNEILLLELLLYVYNVYSEPTILIIIALQSLNLTKMLNNNKAQSPSKRDTHTVEQNHFFRGSADTFGVQFVIKSCY